MTKKDYSFGAIAGLLIGLLAMPVLQAAKPDLYTAFAWYVLPFFLVATPLGLIIAHWLGRKISVIWQIGKFGVIGVLNTLVDLGVLAAVTTFVSTRYGIESNHVLLMIGTWTITIYTIYKAISFVVANINSYVWNKYWTFEAVVKKTRTEYLQFFVVSVVGFVINVTTSSIAFASALTVQELTQGQAGLIGALAGTLLGLVWNFVGYKFIVFKNK